MNENESNEREKYKEEDQPIPSTNEGDPSPFVARKSKRIIKNLAASDGDVWHEHLIVVQVPTESRRKRTCKLNSNNIKKICQKSFLILFPNIDFHDSKAKFQ